ncbi:MAG TPA: FG-GAP-like repeat-containing protein [Candidatus Acidoferrum sp.]|nr:FG-GAP-like repeat-containing protein [Candidatus Acidoferrum sp.]
MQIRLRRSIGGILACTILICGGAMLLASSPQTGQEKSATPKKKAASSSAADAYRLNTLGVAYMNQQRPADAQKYFEQALEADPKFAVARLNLGVSLLGQQKQELARAALEQAAQELPRDPYAWYNLGLLYKDIGEQEKGIAAFQRVTEITQEADAYYFIGYLNTQLQKYDEAIAAFRKGLSLYTYHASSEFGLARALQRKGDSAAAREHLARFQKITTEHLGAPFGAGYGDQGRYSLAELPRSSAVEAPAAVPVRFVAETNPFVSKSGGGNPVAIGASTGACFIDYDGDGKADLFQVSGTADGTSHLLRNLGDGRFEDVTQRVGIRLTGGGLGCAAGDFDNDGKTDLALCLNDGAKLLHNKGDGKFEDVTEAVGIRREKGCVGVTFVDYDHDGDLDLYITMAADSGSPGTTAHNALWRNNGNSTFTEVSAETGLGVAATGAGVVTTDFNNDRAIDFVFAGGSAGASVYLNPREGKFMPLAGIDFNKENLPPAVGVVTFDFDKDGWMDLAFTHAGAPGISLWRNVEGKRLERIPLPDFGWQRGWGIAALDYDNDGWIDLVAAGESSSDGELRLLRNLGSKGWSDVTKDVRLDAVKLKQPRAIAVADIDGNGDADLVVTQIGGGPVVLRNEGGNQHNWLSIELKALNDNKSGIGTKVELYAGTLYQKWEVAGASGYLGQNAGTILAGLGTERSAEVVRLLWPTGVPQDEINLATQKTQSIGELDRRGSSCPILFSWNGREYEFIADMIGPGVVGHWVAPGERDVPDPDEYLKVPARSVKPRNGMLSFRFMEPMEETVYLDQVRLLAIDRPAAYEVFPNERFVSAPPFPEFRVIASRDARPPLGARDDHGNDVLPLISKHDRKYVTGFEDLPFAGFAKLHWIELDLGQWDAKKPLRLILDGYTDYFTATSMYAADQAGIKVIAPYVEAQDAQGKWTRVVEDMGFPAGLERTMVADLTGKLPQGTRRIRIVNNLKIYWDAIRIDQTAESSEVRVAQVPLAKAGLDFIGYPQEIRLKPASDTIYSYAHRSMTGPYARAAGNYTRYGNVYELLRDSDDRFVVFGSGEGLKLDFDPRKLPALPDGWVRDYFFYADGFEKDLDFYAAHAFTVEPLPKHSLLPYPYPEGKEYPADAEHLGYQLEYNTRMRSDKMPPSLRYQYVAPR